MCNEKKTIHSEEKCIKCGKVFTEEDEYCSDEEREMCKSCYIESLRSLSLNVIKKSSFTLSRIFVGFLFGLVIGLDIYYGFGILCDTPIKSILIPILFPLILPLFIGVPKQTIEGIKAQWQKDQNRYCGDDNSIGLIFLLVVVVIFKLLIGLPFWTLWLTFQVTRSLVKAICVYRTTVRALTEISSTCTDSKTEEDSNLINNDKYKGEKT